MTWEDLVSETTSLAVKTCEMRLAYLRKDFTTHEVRIKAIEAKTKDLRRRLPACAPDTQPQLFSFTILEWIGIISIAVNVFAVVYHLCTKEWFSRLPKHSIPARSRTWSKAFNKFL